MKLRNLLGQFRSADLIERRFKLPSVVWKIVLVLYAGVGLGTIITALKTESIKFLSEVTNAKTIVIQSNEQGTEEAEQTDDVADDSREIHSCDTQDCIEQKIKEAFPECPAVAVAIAKAESGLEPTRIGDKHLIYYDGDTIFGDSVGIYQIRILPGRPTREELMDVDFNIQYARQMYEDGGWGAWSVFKNGSFKNHL